jgi:hypothetical protein
MHRMSAATARIANRSTVARPIAASPVAPQPIVIDSTEVLARRLCTELQALTGNANSTVMIDTMAIRLRVGYRDLEPALAFGARRGWIDRRPDSIALSDAGRVAAQTSWPPADTQ